MKTINHKNKRTKGFSIIEVILAAAMFIYLVAVAGSVVIHAFSANRLGEEETKAALLASEGLEAVRSIKNQNFANLISGNYDVVINESLWQFGPTPTPGGKFARTINIGDVYRDGEGEIIESGGTLDEEAKKITSTVFWQFSPSRSNSVEMITYLTDWVSGICFWSDYNILGSGDIAGKRGAQDVFVAGEYAYLVTYSVPSGDEFYIFDITDPSGELVLKGSLNFDATVNAVYVVDNFAYLATNKNDQELIVINVSDPQNPQEVGFYNATKVDPVNGMDVWVDGTKVYFSTAKNPQGEEFIVLEADTSDPYNVTLSRLGSAPINDNVNSIFIDGNYAYLATSDTNNELQIVDISNPANPQLICWYNIEPSSADAFGNGVFVQENRAFVVTGKNGQGAEYYVLNLNPPFDNCSQNPGDFITEAGSVEMAADVNDVFIYEGYIFLATEKSQSQLMAASLDDPTNFFLSIDLGGEAYAVYVYQCLAYVATGRNEGELFVVQPQ
ncbi:hypothetical protein ISS85_01470 [Candidatus Microgenomates bacterium]|nr:hypothetical protein [Candidatus Microgenomates bacterium]